MKEKSIGFLSSFFIQGKLLVAMNGDWENVLGNNPTFEVIIDKDGRYTLRGPRVNHNPRGADPAAVTGGHCK